MTLVIQEVSMLAASTSVANNPITPFTGGIAGLTSYFDSFRVAQTFTASSGGELESISVALAQNGPKLPENVIVEFRLSYLGMPSTSLLASSTIDGSLLEGVQPVAPAMLIADFSADKIHLEEGSIYAFSLRIEGEGGAFACGHGFGPYDVGAFFDSWDSGATWTERPIIDLNFNVTVAPVPVPEAPPLGGSMLAMSMAVFSMAVYRRKHGRIRRNRLPDESTGPAFLHPIHDPRST